MILVKLAGFYVYSSCLLFCIFTFLCVKRLFALLQAATGVAVSTHIYMFKAHAALGEGLQAVALMKSMRAVGLPVPAPACSLLVLAFCKADALQVQHTVYAFTAHLPCALLCEFMQITLLLLQ